MHDRLWQLLPLLLGLRVSGEAPDCSNANQTVTVQLSRTHILRTWQPDGAHCRWWENRQSETNQFPAAVRSGPRWLVMQLRQPMMLEEVSVRGWDGQWQAAAPVGSPVSALGASSLPLKLQLQDPCRAPLEAFNNSDRWMQLEGQPVSFILLASSQTLGWSSLSLTGRIVPMQLKANRNPFCLNCEPLNWRPGDTIRFLVSSCGSQPPNCWVRMADGGLNKTAMLASRPGADSSRITHFEYSVPEKEIPRTLECWQGDSAAVRIEREIGLAHESMKHTLSVSPVLISGRPAFVEFVMHGVFPEPKIQCLISASSDVALKRLSQSRSVVKDDEGRVLLSVRSKFSFTAKVSMNGGEILCWLNFRESLITHGRFTQTVIANISEPCQTEVVLGSSRYWKVGDTWRITVTSRNCSIWNVSHSCRLLLAEAASSVALRKVQQGSFSSAHELQVSRSMALQNWSVWCSVNQSGVMHDEAESLEELQPYIFYPARIIVSNARIGNHQVFLAVTVSASRPPVSSVTCLISIALRLNSTAQLSRTKAADVWAFEGQLLISANNPRLSDSPVEFSCSGWQVFNGSLIFQSRSSIKRIKVQQFELETSSSSIITTDSTSSRVARVLESPEPFWTVYSVPLSHIIVASASVVAIIVFIAIVSSVLTWKVSLSRLRRDRQRRRSGTAVPMRPLPLAAATSTGAGSSAYDYPRSGTVAPGSSNYSEVGESSAMSSVYVVLTPPRIQQQQQQQQQVSSFAARQQI